MVVHKLTLGSAFQANCYIMENEEKEAVAIDIGGDSQEFLKFINEHNLTLKKILLTHGHYDHFKGVADVVKSTGTEVFIHTADKNMLTSADESLASFIGNNEKFNEVDKCTTFSDGEIIDFSGTPINVVYTPGHTKGCVCFICEDKLFSGDTLFRMSIGRTDLPGGDYSTIKHSLAVLKDIGRYNDYEVYPGHDSMTTLSYEIKNNQYMKD